MFLLEFVAFVAPGGGLVYFIWRRLVKSTELVTVVRVDAARTGARLEAANRAVGVAEDTAREALASTRQALETARVIELVDEKVQVLTDYLVSQIEGTAGGDGGGWHARPAFSVGEDYTAITVGGEQEGFE